MPAEDSRLCLGQAATLTLSQGMLSCAIAASVRLKLAYGKRHKLALQKTCISRSETMSRCSCRDRLVQHALGAIFPCVTDTLSFIRGFYLIHYT